MTDTLTGRSRHRVSWRGKLVLQVEITQRVPTGWFGDCVTHRTWRDAKAEDLTVGLTIERVEQ